MARYVLSISELAKLKNITTETLRHYDRIGLFKPEYLSKSGRRMYSIRQYERLGTILELREIGMSLSEIKEYLDNRNVQKSIDILKRHQQKWDKELEEQIQLNRIMHQKLKFLDSLSRLPQMETVFEETFPDRYMVTFGKTSGSREEHAMAFTRLEQYVNEKIPILASDRVGVFSDRRLLIPGGDLVQAVPMLLVSLQNADPSHLKKIPAGKYVCMYYRNGILEKYDSSFEKLNSYMEENHYQICGNILQIYKIDVTLSDDPEETVIEIQIPVH